METARNVLDSEEVRQAIADHDHSSNDGLTGEQRAYMEFVKSLDAKNKSDANTKQDPTEESDLRE